MSTVRLEFIVHLNKLFLSRGKCLFILVLAYRLGILSMFSS